MVVSRIKPQIPAILGGVITCALHQCKHRLLHVYQQREDADKAGWRERVHACKQTHKCQERATLSRAELEYHNQKSSSMKGVV